MGAERTAMVFTDPPYTVPIDGDASGLGAIHHRPFPMAAGEMDKAGFTAFLGQACRNLAAFSLGGVTPHLCIGLGPVAGIFGARPVAYCRVEKLLGLVLGNRGNGVALP